MVLLKGKPVADAHKEVLREKLKDIPTGTITMAILQVGEDMASLMYARFMKKTAESMGFGAELIELPETASQTEVEAVVQRLNEDSRIYGVLPLMPMPPQIKADQVIDLLDPAKDIDGLTVTNMGLMNSGRGGFAPCTPRACLAMLDYYKIPLEGRQVAIVGRSNVVGKPMAALALQRNATITVCHSRTADLGEALCRADIVIAAAGRPGIVTGAMIKEGAVVIDVGINEADGQTVGDADYESVAAKAGAVTPVPGGVGSVTTIMMLEALYEAYHARNVNC